MNYAITRTFRTSEYPAIYDAGSSGIRATVASFTTAKDPKTGAAGTRIVVAGAGTTGGVELDRRMREILVDAFNAKRGKDTWEEKRVVETGHRPQDQSHACLMYVLLLFASNCADVLTLSFPCFR